MTISDLFNNHEGCYHQRHPCSFTKPGKIPQFLQEYVVCYMETPPSMILSVIASTTGKCNNCTHRSSNNDGEGCMKDTEQRSLLKSLSTDALLHILRSTQEAHIVSVQYLLHAGSSHQGRDGSTDDTIHRLVIRIFASFFTELDVFPITQNERATTVIICEEYNNNCTPCILL
jgi:hypothetical protein